MPFYTDYPLYPTAIFDDDNYPTQVDDDDTVYAALVNALKEELQACFAELGTIPKGTFVSVKARLDYYSNWQKYTQAAGRVSGGAVTDAGFGKINIASGAGYFKTSDSEIGVTVYLTWSSVSDFVLDDNAVNYIHINYNGGTPVIQKTTDRATIELNREFTIARVYRSGNDLHILNSGVNLPNFFRNEHERLLSVRGFERATGGVISEPAGRYLKATAGLFYFGLNTITTILQDTTGAHRFTSWYRASPSGWTKVADQAQVDNEYYDDGDGTLHLVSANRYGVFWIYVHYDSDIHVVYGRDSYKLSEAEAALIPDDLPDQVSSFATFAAKVIIKRDAASFTSITSGYKKLFPTTSPSDHNDLAGLQGGKADQYYHLTLQRHTELANLLKLELDYMEYPNNTAARLAYVTSSAVGSLWTAADQVGGGPGNYHTNNNRNFRSVIDAAHISTNSNLIRVLFSNTGGAGTMYIDGASIVERSGVSDDGTTTPTRLQFNSSDSTTIAAGQTKWSDWVVFTIDSTKDYLVHLYREGKDNYEDIWTDAAGHHYYKDSAVDYTDDQNVDFNTHAEITGVAEIESAGPLQCFSENTIVQKEPYSLKVVADQTDSLNETLTKTVSPVKNLTAKGVITLWARSDRTGENFKVEFHDSGGNTISYTVNILIASTWEEKEIDISGVSDVNKDAIDEIKYTILNADAAAEIYLDNNFAP